MNAEQVDHRDNLYRPMTLRLYAFALQRLNDYNWTGMELFDHVKSGT